MARISKEFVERLNEQLPEVLQVMGVKMKGSRPQQLVRCFSSDHDDSNASMSLNTDSHVFNCHGCGCSGGGAIQAYAAYSGLDAQRDFVNVVEQLSSQLSMSVEYEDSPQSQKNADIHEALQAVAQYALSPPYFEDDKLALSQYLNERNINSDLMKRGKLGYLSNSFATSPVAKKYKEPLIEAGILGVDDKTGATYSPFSRRLIFPIADRNGKIIALAGRVFMKGDGRAKYRNSNETGVFKKSRVLYGLNDIAKESQSPERIMVTEGYMDRLRSTGAGIASVATMGTALTTAHLRLLARHTKQAVFALDPDQAGQDATERALLAALPFIGKLDVRFAQLPSEGDEKYDPDRYILTHGADAMNRLLDNALDTIHMAAEYIAPSHHKTIQSLLQDDMQGKAAKVFDALPDDFTRPLILSELAKIVGENLNLSIHPEHLGLSMDQAETIRTLNYEMEELRNDLAVAESRVAEMTTQPNTTVAIAQNDNESAPPLDDHIPAHDLDSSMSADDYDFPPVNEPTTPGTSNSVQALIQKHKIGSKPESVESETPPAAQPSGKGTKSEPLIAFKLSHYGKGTPTRGDWMANESGELLRFAAVEGANTVVTHINGNQSTLSDISGHVRVNVATTIESKFNGPHHKKGDEIVKVGDHWLGRLPAEHVAMAHTLLNANPMILFKDSEVCAKAAALAFPEDSDEEIKNKKATDVKRQLGYAVDQRKAPNEIFSPHRPKVGDCVTSTETRGQLRKVESINGDVITLVESKKQKVNKIAVASTRVINIEREQESSFDNRHVEKGEPIYLVTGMEGWQATIPEVWLREASKEVKKEFESASPGP